MADDKTIAVAATLADPQFKAGRALVDAGRLEEAVNFFSSFLEVKVQTLDDEMSPALAPLYYEFGNALLYYAEECGDVFGDAITEAESQKAIAHIKACISGEVGSADGASEAGGEGGVSNGEDGQAPQTGAEEDLEIAWENLDLARKIYSEITLTDEVKGLLGKVHLRLGDLNMLNGMYANAAEEFSKCLELRLSILGSSCNRGVADVHVRRAQALFYASTLEGSDKVNLVEQAISQYEAAAEVLMGMLKAMETSGMEKGEAMVKAEPEAETRLESQRVPPLEGKDKGKGKAKTPPSKEGASLQDVTTENEAEPQSGAACSVDEITDLLDTIRETIETMKSGKDMEALADYKSGATSGGTTTIGFGAPGGGEDGTTTVGFGSAPATVTTGGTSGFTGAGATTSSGAGGNVMVVKRKPKTPTMSDKISKKQKDTA
ncbi:unnamed protein product [Choristocarpus tenellus]